MYVLMILDQFGYIHAIFGDLTSLQDYKNQWEEYLETDEDSNFNSFPIKMRGSLDSGEPIQQTIIPSVIVSMWIHKNGKDNL